jgi:hypothetical protein
MNETVADRQARLSGAQGYDTSRLKTRVDLASILTPEHFEVEREKIELPARVFHPEYVRHPVPDDISHGSPAGWNRGVGTHPL